MTKKQNQSTPSKVQSKKSVEAPMVDEHFEPTEGNARVPAWLFLSFIALAMWGGWYISEYDGGFRSNIYDGPDASGGFDSSNASNASAKKAVDPVKLGKRVFNTCVTCHQANGQGLDGKYPPLHGSEWVAGDDRILARIVLNGLHGPIEVAGKKYNEQMMPWKVLTDHDIAAVLTHVRSSWGHDFPAVAPSTVAAVRAEIADRETQFTAEELKSVDLPEVQPVPADQILAEYQNATVSDLLESDESRWITNIKEPFVIERLAVMTGDAAKGKSLFTTATCTTCHIGSETKQSIGPLLTEVSKRLKREEIVDSILHPSAVIAKGYESVKLLTYEEKVLVGVVVSEDDENIKLRLASGEEIDILTDDIEERAKSKVSAMPVGLVNALTLQQAADLIAYLESL